MILDKDFVFEGCELSNMKKDMTGRRLKFTEGNRKRGLFENMVEFNLRL